MSAFLRVMMLVTMALLAQTGMANAGQSAKLQDPQFHALVHGVVTEGYYDAGQMLGITQVIANRAYIYGNPDNLSKVVYNKKEMNGPQDKKTPWVGTEAERFRDTAQFLKPYYHDLKDDKLVDPKLAKAWHFDMRPHTDWGAFVAKRCTVVQGKNRCVWFYQAANKSVTARLAKRALRMDVASAE